MLTSKKKLLKDDELIANICDTIQKTDVNWSDLITHQDHIIKKFNSLIYSSWKFIIKHDTNV